VDLNCRDTNGRTLFEITIDQNSFLAIVWLAHHGADLEFPVANGKTPLAYAVERCNGTIGRMLLDLGANAAVLTKEEHEELQKGWSMLERIDLDTINWKQ